MARFGVPRRPGALNDNQPIAINWRRGLFRVWLLVSLAWIMGLMVYLVMFGIHGGFKNDSDFFEVPVLLVGPPVALYLLGAIARWAFKGFAPDDRPPSA